MAQRYKDILFSYGGLISNKNEIQQISDIIENLKKSYAQADVSEIMDLAAVKLSRNPKLLKKFLELNTEKPFFFIHCLN